MSKTFNLFALLGDEEEDDVTVLVEHFSKKVEVGATKAAAVVETKKQQSQNQSQQVSSENRGGREGRNHGPRNDKFVRKEDQFGNEQMKRPNGNGYGQVRGGSRVRGRGKGYSNENGSVDEKKTNEDESDGWQVVGKTHLKEDTNRNLSEQRPFRNGNRNYGGERRGYRRGSRDAMDKQFQNIKVKENVDSNKVMENGDKADVNAVNIESSNALSEGDAAPVTEESKEISAEEKKTEENAKAGKPTKKVENEDENLMTLEEYEKVLSEKRKALEALKNEERKVAADKDLEAMQQLAKKKEEDLMKPETSKLKKKDSPEKDDKSRKTVSIEEIFVYRRPGRGRGHGGVSGDFRKGDRSSQQGGLRNRDNGKKSELGNKVYPKEAKKVKDSPIVQIEDKGQFPVLKGAALAV